MSSEDINQEMGLFQDQRSLPTVETTSAIGASGDNNFFTAQSNQIVEIEGVGTVQVEFEESLVQNSFFEDEIGLVEEEVTTSMHVEETVESGFEATDDSSVASNPASLLKPITKKRKKKNMGWRKIADTKRANKEKDRLSTKNLFENRDRNVKGEDKKYTELNANNLPKGTPYPQ